MREGRGDGWRVEVWNLLTHPRFITFNMRLSRFVVPLAVAAHAWPACSFVAPVHSTYLQPCRRPLLSMALDDKENNAALIQCAVANEQQELPFIGSEGARITSAVAPDDPGQAIGIVSELKGNAALFAAFAFGSLNLPSTLTISESKATALGVGVTTARPNPDALLLQPFVVLDIATLCFMITCVATSQLLIYRLADGSYGTVKYSTEASFDPRDTPTGRLSTQYRSEFWIARSTFALGLGCLLVDVGVKTVATFPESIALPGVAVIGAATTTIFTFYLTSFFRVFEKFKPEDDEPLENPVPWTAPAVLGAFLAVFLTSGTYDARELESAASGKASGSSIFSRLSGVRTEIERSMSSTSEASDTA